MLHQLYTRCLIYYLTALGLLNAFRTCGSILLPGIVQRLWGSMRQEMKPQRRIKSIV